MKLTRRGSKPKKQPKTWRNSRWKEVSPLRPDKMPKPTRKERS